MGRRGHHRQPGSAHHSTLRLLNDCDVLLGHWGIRSRQEAVRMEVGTSTISFGSLRRSLRKLPYSVPPVSLDLTLALALSLCVCVSPLL